RHCLRRRCRVDRQQFRERLDRRRAGRLDLFGTLEPLRETRRPRHRLCDLDIGREIAVLAGHESVLTRAGRRQEVPRAAAAHDPRLGRHLVELEPAALEDLRIRLAVLAEALVKAGLVAVERVRVLHDELADADQPAAWPGLIAVLGLEVVPGLRQLLVALDLPRVESERLLVRERKHVMASCAVVELEELRDRVAPRRLPELCRREHGRKPFLCPDLLELLADDLLDLAMGAPAKGRERPEARGHLPDEPGADEQLVADGLGLGRGVAQGWEKELRSLKDHALPNEATRLGSARPLPWPGRRAWPSSTVSAGASRRRSTCRSRGTARRRGFPTRPSSEPAPGPRQTRRPRPP